VRRADSTAQAAGAQAIPHDDVTRPLNEGQARRLRPTALVALVTVEVALQLPVRDLAVEVRDLLAARGEKAVADVGPQRREDRLVRLEGGERFIERGRQGLDAPEPRTVLAQQVFLKRFGERHLLADAVETGDEHDRGSEIGIAGRVRAAQLQAGVRATAGHQPGHANERRPVDVRPADIGRRLDAGAEALVGIHQGREHRDHGAGVMQLPGQEAAAGLRQAIFVPGVAEQIRAGIDGVQALVRVHAGARQIAPRTRHEGAVQVAVPGHGLQRHARGQDLVGGGQGLLIAEVNLVLAGADFMVGGDDRHPQTGQRGHHLAPDGLAKVGGEIEIAGRVVRSGRKGDALFIQLKEEELQLDAGSEAVAQLARLLQGDLNTGSTFERFRDNLRNSPGDLVILEAAGSLSEGLLYGLSLVQLAQTLDAPVVLVQLWHDSRSVDDLLEAQQELGSHLVGIVLNAVNPDDVPRLEREVSPALERLGLPVFGVMPRSPLLRSVTVAELARRLQAEVVCCGDRLDLLVETLSIGAMNVNSAMEFFRRRRNMAVVTGADRTDIQLAALEASTQCLILTGVGDPLPPLVGRAEELEVPLLRVEQDTLTTVEVIEQAFGHVRLHEAVKATYAFRLVEQHCRFEPLLEQLELT